MNPKVNCNLSLILKDTLKKVPPSKGAPNYSLLETKSSFFWKKFCFEITLE